MKKEKENPKNEFDTPIKYSDEYYYTLLNKSRRILLYAEINDSSAYVCNYKMRAMDMEECSPIYLEINSCGGSVIDGLSIIDTMNALKSPVITIASGIVASMAFLISIAGKKRWAYKNAWFMQHPVSSMMGEDYAQFVKDQVGFLVRLEKQTETLMKQYTRLNEQQFTKIRNGELWLSTKQAKRFGVIDKII